MFNIKDKTNNLRTKISGVIPNILNFAKIILVAFLSGIVWLLHFIGMIFEICLDVMVQLKQHFEKDKSIIDNTSLDKVMQEQINDKEKN